MYVLPIYLIIFTKCLWDRAYFKMSCYSSGKVFKCKQHLTVFFLYYQTTVTLNG